jgi:hypothetical protein
MFNASFYIKFLWIGEIEFDFMQLFINNKICFKLDDYYISGMLARACNAVYESINSLYIVNRNLVEQQFLGKKSFYTVFGKSKCPNL